MSHQALSKINNRYHTALAVHRELADTFWYIYLPGYAMMNEYQLLDEGFTQRRLKRYITSTYHIAVPDVLPSSANILDPLTKDKNRKKLKTDDNWQILKSAFQAYQTWEEATLEEYQKIAADILANGEVSVFNFVGDLIKDVKAELTFVTDTIIELSATDWDMPTIVAEQDTILERYEYKIRNLLDNSGDHKYHHYNSNVDAESRMAILDV